MLSVSPSDLLARLARGEDNLVERKPRFDADDVRMTVVAFANTIQAPNTGVLFLGVSDDGVPLPGGIPNPDKAQKQVARAIEWCYPEIPDISMFTLNPGGVAVVAVVVGESARRPHFTGPAYVRVGSSSKRASDEAFEELIADRVSPAKLLRPWLSRIVRIERETQHAVGRYPPQWTGHIERAELKEVTARGIRLWLASGQIITPTWQRLQVEPSVSDEPPLIRIALWGNV